MSVRGPIILNCLSKDKVEMNDVMLVEQRIKEKKKNYVELLISFSKKILTFYAICLNNLRYFL